MCELLSIRAVAVNLRRFIYFVGEFMQYGASITEMAMPSKTPKQARLMRAADHSPSFAKKAGVPVKVAKEFAPADKGKKK